MDMVTMREDVVGLFPGQGAISGGAGIPWRGSRHWDLLPQISDAAKVNVEHLLLEASDSEIVRTDRAQIATFTLSIIGFFELVDAGVVPRYLLGHSLGEFSALVASGLLSVEEGARLIGIRGRAMAAAAESSEGSMVAVMGASEGARANLEALDGVWVANINGADQIVLSGTKLGLDYVVANHKELGWKRAAPLSVGGAFHSPLMSAAQSELDAGLASAHWGETEHILIANVDARPHGSAQEWTSLLSQQLTSPVEFFAATLALPQSVNKTIEMPPAGVLTGLTKRIREFETQVAPLSLEEMKQVKI
jgi:[acyl-carrier-protein] S-malonyltransferase